MHSLSVPDILSLVVSVGFPNLMGILSREHWSGTVKWFILAAISTTSGVVSQLTDSMQHGTPFNGQATLTTSALTLAVATAVHYGLMNDTSISKATDLGSGSVDLPVPPSAGNPVWEPTPLPSTVTLGSPATVDVTPVPEAPAPVVDVTPAADPVAAPAPAPAPVAPAAPAAPQHFTL